MCYLKQCNYSINMVRLYVRQCLTGKHGMKAIFTKIYIETRHKQADFTQPLIGPAAAINVRPLIVQSYKDKQRQRQLG